ncbi:hypothetical protein CY34DRAFT_272477 [Suillus luteus UH-Slu-Lm8-n1]|uniref:Uncharacterized protein n=1 Tax=Suillus luteus UH-Slu-Lm8-n1 TaxID=930992 RepID=A0A0D0AF75_9AGAM|nr:hypothetical protein CY34DRAFT_272477 [Suillus luteus UH-Slu-Lm8-n1]
MQTSNIVVRSAISRSNEITSLNHVPGTFRASNAWCSGPAVNRPLNQRFPDDSSYSPEFLAVQNSGHQHHVNYNTAFRSIPENPMLSHSEATNDRLFFYPPDPSYPPPQVDDLNQAYICADNLFGTSHKNSLRPCKRCHHSHRRNHYLT